MSQVRSRAFFVKSAAAFLWSTDCKALSITFPGSCLSFRAISNQ